MQDSYMKTVTVNVPEWAIEYIDYCVEGEMWGSRAHFLRNAIRYYVSRLDEFDTEELLSEFSGSRNTITLGGTVDESELRYIHYLLSAREDWKNRTDFLRCALVAFVLETNPYERREMENTVEPDAMAGHATPIWEDLAPDVVDSEINSFTTKQALD